MRSNCLFAQDSHQASQALGRPSGCRVHEALKTTLAKAIGVADRLWTITQLVDAALNVAPALPKETPPDRRRRFTVIQGGKPIKDAAPFRARRSNTILGIILLLDPNLELSLSLPRATKLYRTVNRIVGVDGFYINVAALDIDGEEIFSSVKAHFDTDKYIPA